MADGSELRTVLKLNHKVHVCHDAVGMYMQNPTFKQLLRNKPLKTEYTNLTVRLPTSGKPSG